MGTGAFSGCVEQHNEKRFLITTQRPIVNGESELVMQWCRTNTSVLWNTKKERRIKWQTGMETCWWCVSIPILSSAGFLSVWCAPLLRWVLLSLVRLFPCFFPPICHDKTSLNFLIYCICEEKTKDSLFPFFTHKNIKPNGCVNILIMHGLLWWGHVKEIGISDL